MAKENNNEIFNKEATSKNIYRTIVDKHTKKYEITSEMKWNSIRQEILQWKWMWQNTFTSYNMLHENNIYFKMLHRFYMLIKNDNAYSKNKLTPLCNNCKTKKEKGNHIARTP